MSTSGLRPSPKYAHSPGSRRAPPEDSPHHLHRTSSDKRTRNPLPQRHSYSSHPRHPSKTSSSTSKRHSKMGQAPQNPQPDQLYYYFPEMQGLDPTKELDMQLQPWMMGTCTIIEDDDLMFGGKSLSTLYEEDRRRYSLGEESAPSIGFDDEEERRGRPRDRHFYEKPSHKSRGKSGKSDVGEKKH